MRKIIIKDTQILKNLIRLSQTLFGLDYSNQEIVTFNQSRQMNNTTTHHEQGGNCKTHPHKVNGECFICCENASSVIYYPCLHTGMCQFCGFRNYLQDQRCPLCRDEVESLIAYEMKSVNNEGVLDEEN